MDPIHDRCLCMTRRHFFGLGASGLGTAVLASLFGRDLMAGAPAKAAGGPSQMDLFDYKPVLKEKRGEELPASIRMGQRLTGMTATQDRLPVAPSIFKFAQYGKSGAWISELLPHTAKIADDLCFVKSVNTDAINHDPAV